MWIESEEGELINLGRFAFISNVDLKNGVCAVILNYKHPTQRVLCRGSEANMTFAFMKIFNGLLYETPLMKAQDYLPDVRLTKEPSDAIQS